MKTYLIIFSLIAFSLISCKGKKKQSPKPPISSSIKKAVDSTSISKREDNGVIKMDTTKKNPIFDTTNMKVLRFGDDNEMRFPTKIRFVSGKVIDIRTVDPYAHVNGKELKIWDGGLERLYDLKAISQIDKDNLLKGIRLNKDAYCVNNYLRLLTKTPRVEIAGGKTVIAYHAAIYCAEDEILGTHGYALVYDNNGKLLHKIKDKKDGFYDIRLSADGKYLMQKYGYDYGEGGEGQLERGFKFYDTNTGEMVFEWELGKDKYSISFENNRPNSGFNLFKDEYGQTEWYYIFPHTKSIYVKKMIDSKKIDDFILEIHPRNKINNLEFVAQLISHGFKKIK